MKRELKQYQWLSAWVAQASEDIKTRPKSLDCPSMTDLYLELSRRQAVLRDFVNSLSAETAEYVLNPKKDLWIWYWKQGGYNSCYASSKEDALEQAKQTCCAYLEVEESTLHIGTEDELNRLDSLYN